MVVVLFVFLVFWGVFNVQAETKSHQKNLRSVWPAIHHFCPESKSGGYSVSISLLVFQKKLSDLLAVLVPCAINKLADIAALTCQLKSKNGRGFMATLLCKITPTPSMVGSFKLMLNYLFFKS